MFDKENYELLKAQIQNRDPETLKNLLDSNSAALIKAAKGLGFRNEQLEDLIQEVWLTFFKSIASFEGKSQLKTYLFGILYNKALEINRKNSRLEFYENTDLLIDQKFNERNQWSELLITPENFLETAENLKEISACLDQLPINQKMAFILKEIDEEKTEDICNILNITVTNLGVILYRAKNKLRDCIEFKSQRKV